MFYLIMYWELTGTEHPENIMVVGGHLDSWDLADGSGRWSRGSTKYGGR
jgi:hypothetical protein